MGDYPLIIGVIFSNGNKTNMMSGFYDVITPYISVLIILFCTVLII